MLKFTKLYSTFPNLFKKAVFMQNMQRYFSLGQKDTIFYPYYDSCELHKFVSWFFMHVLANKVKCCCIYLLKTTFIS